MKRAIFVFLILGVIVGVAYAASYTITTTTAQEAVLARGLAEYNAAHPEAPYADNQAFLIGELCAPGFVQLKANQQQADSLAFQAKCKTLTAAQQNAICSAAGLADGCNPCP